MGIDARIINAVLLGKQVYNQEVEKEKQAVAEWLDNNLFDKIREAAEIGSSHLDLRLLSVPDCRHGNKAFYIRSYVDGIEGLSWGKMGGTSGYNDYVRIKWAKEIGEDNE